MPGRAGELVLPSASDTVPSAVTVPAGRVVARAEHAVRSGPGQCHRHAGQPGSPTPCCPSPSTSTQYEVADRGRSIEAVVGGQVARPRRNGDELGIVRSRQHVAGGVGHCDRVRAGSEPGEAICATDTSRGRERLVVGAPEDAVRTEVRRNEPHADDPRLAAVAHTVTVEVLPDQVADRGRHRPPEVVPSFVQPEECAEVGCLDVVGRERVTPWQACCVDRGHEATVGADRERVGAVHVGDSGRDCEVADVDLAVAVGVAVQGHGDVGGAGLAAERAVPVDVVEHGAGDTIRRAGQARNRFVVAAGRDRVDRGCHGRCRVDAVQVVRGASVGGPKRSLGVGAEAFDVVEADTADGETPDVDGGSSEPIDPNEVVADTVVGDAEHLTVLCTDAQIVDVLQAGLRLHEHVVGPAAKTPGTNTPVVGSMRNKASRSPRRRDGGPRTARRRTGPSRGCRHR